MKIVTNVPPRPPEPPVTYDIVGIDRETFARIVMIVDHATHGGIIHHGYRDFIQKGNEALYG